jgi:molybdopterin synthase catalytic subunit
VADVSLFLARVTPDPLDASALLASVSSPSDGAVLLFWGIVRDHNQGRAVAHLEYDAYIRMAESVLAEIVDEARTRWQLGGLGVVHRIGRLEIGESSVGIAVASPHRAEAYEASRYVIEELKRRAPIWKREVYAEGGGEWLHGQSPAQSTQWHDPEEWGSR